MTRPDNPGFTDDRRKIDEMRQDELLKYLRETAAHMSAAVDRLETLTTTGDGDSAREDIG